MARAVSNAFAVSIGLILLAAISPARATVTVESATFSPASFMDGKTVRVTAVVSSDETVAARFDVALMDPDTGKWLVDYDNALFVAIEPGQNTFERDFFVNAPPGVDPGPMAHSIAFRWDEEEATLAGEGIVSLLTPVSMPLRVLMYHKVGPVAYSPWWVTTKEFEGQMRFLKHYGYTVITLDDFMAYRLGEAPLPRKPILITFDDGYENLLTEAYPILSRPDIDFTAVCFAISRRMGETNEWDEGDNDPIINHLTYDQARFLHSTGVIDFQSHTQTHKNLANIADDPERLHKQLRGSKEDIETSIGGRVVHFCYPGGNGADIPAVHEAITQAGYFFSFAYTGIEDDCANKWAIERLYFDWHASVNYDPEVSGNFVPNILEDPDVVYPIIEQPTIEALDPLTGQALTGPVQAGQRVRLRVRTFNNRNDVWVRSLLRLDNDANADNGVLYDSHTADPCEDVGMMFLDDTYQTLEWTVEAPALGEAATIHAQVDFHDDPVVLRYRRLDWTPVFEVAPADGVAAWRLY